MDAATASRLTQRAKDMETAANKQKIQDILAEFEREISLSAKQGNTVAEVRAFPSPHREVVLKILRERGFQIGLRFPALNDHSWLLVKWGDVAQEPLPPEPPEGRVLKEGDPVEMMLARLRTRFHPREKVSVWQSFSNWFKTWIKS